MRILLFILFLLTNHLLIGQESSVYNWSWKNDGITLGAGATVWIGAQFLKEKADKATLDDLRLLNRVDVWAFDRGAIGNNSESARSLSNTFLFSSIALPFVPLLDKHSKGERTAIIGMAIEGFLITDGITNIFKATAKRFRPYTYDPAILDEDKLNATARQSFISGHTSVTAFATFFTAKVLTDLHPNSKLKPLIWTSAVAIPAFTGYLRYIGGRHFPTDIITGYAFGAAVGYLVPQLHKNDRLTVGMNSNGAVRISFVF